MHRGAKTNLMFYLFYQSATLRPLWFDGKFGTRQGQGSLLTASWNCGIMSINFVCIKWNNCIRTVALQELYIKMKDEIIERQ